MGSVLFFLYPKEKERENKYNRWQIPMPLIILSQAQPFYLMEDSVVRLYLCDEWKKLGSV